MVYRGSRTSIHANFFPTSCHGGSGRNTAILRSNYRTEEGTRFYDESLRLYENLAGELDYNLMFNG